MTTARAEELVANLATVRDRIAAACRSGGRQPDEVTLTVVTKFFPASDVRLLVDLGVTDVGENRHQEAEAKIAECADLEVRWHYIGGLQSNKAAAVAAYADVVESVDRLKIVSGLERGAQNRDRPLDVLLQVSLDPPGQVDGRAGVAQQDLPQLAERVETSPWLTLCGLMAVAPRSVEPTRAFAEFSDIVEGFQRDHPQATQVSAGMSGDLEAAILHGATHVRIGSAVLGERPIIK